MFLSILSQWVSLHMQTRDIRSLLREFHHAGTSLSVRILADKLFPFLWAPTLLLCFLTGCQAFSEWDQQWLEIQTLIQEGRLQDAKELLRHILPPVRNNGPTDARYGQVIFQLGEIARLEGQPMQAEAYYWETLPLIVQSLGPEHVNMADPLAALASLYHQKGESTMAVPLLKRALAIREKTWGPSDPQLLPTLIQYHGLLLATDRHQDAGNIHTRIHRLQRAS